MKHRINENDMAIDPVGLMNKGLSVGDVIDVVMAPRHTIPGTENIQEHTPDVDVLQELQNQIAFLKDQNKEQQDKINSLLDGVKSFNDSVDKLCEADITLHIYRKDADAPGDIYGNFFYALNKRLEEASFTVKDDIGAHEQPIHNVGIGADTTI